MAPGARIMGSMRIPSDQIIQLSPAALSGLLLSLLP